MNGRPRPRPVLILAAVAAALGAVIGAAGLTDIIPKQVMGYLVLANGVLTAVLGVVAQGQVTPLADPHNAAGTPLVPATDREGRRLAGA